VHGRGGCLVWGVWLGSSCELGRTPSGRLRLNSVARSVTDIQWKSQPSPCLPVPRWKSDPNPIVPNELPPASHPRVHLVGSNGKSFTAG
jgi:hypothetical protein